MISTYCMKEVRFDEYCHKCEHHNGSEHSEPCDECLCVGARENTHKPWRFKERTGKATKKAASKKTTKRK